MILTVTLNAALDVTYRVEALVRHATHRVAEVQERAGGKGLNVARVLHGLGEPVRATGLLGGDTGARVQRLLIADGIASDFHSVADETRRTVAVVDSDATGFWEPGPVVTPEEWNAFQARYASLVREAAVVVLSGSLPRGLPVDAYATLITAARDAGARTVLDTSGDPLRAALSADPDIIKPNLSELRTLLFVLDAEDGADDADERWPTSEANIAGGAGAVRVLGPGAVVVSRGPDGLLAATPEGLWRARPPETLTGNPTGAGDASVAALARGLRDRAAWPDVLADAVALSAAAVAAPVAGTVDPETATRFRTTINVTRMTAEGDTRPGPPLASSAESAAPTTADVKESPAC
ncbi:1-phosphofructokinase family hexose kinase [Cryptosporangium sp. NPDC048952]|uniref:1-phosphofructokinase family hexose kinase n=1 Tax=Cryptosporangium sp. NPDC048952 TaxID=3363961 RepID=UPI00371F69AE